jgi:CubicO group peptidase (beta-lactamase class C family)
LPCFLSVAALRLAEKGELELDAPLARYVPALGYDDRVVVDMLLSHTSGIPDYADLLEATGHLGRPFDPEPILAWLAEGPLAAEPGTCVRYSATNDFLLGRVIERVTGESVHAHLEEALFAGAGLADTGWTGAGPARHRAPVAQELGGGGDDERGAPAPFEAEGLCTTALDLLRFQRALDSGALLATASMRLRASPARLRDGEEVATGRGIELALLEEHPCHSAGGALGGQRVHLARYPTLGATVAILASGTDVPTRALGARVARALLAREHPEVRDLPLGPEVLARYVGEYYAGCSSYGIAADGEHLALFLPSGAKQRLLHQGGEDFVFARDPDVRVCFELDDGRVVALILDEHGVRTRARRVS